MAIGKATSFIDVKVSQTAIHGYVTQCDNATKYRVYYRTGSEEAKSIVIQSDRYFYISDVTSGNSYILNYRGENDDGTSWGNTSTVAESSRTFVVKNDRSTWSTVSMDSIGELEKKLSFECTTDDYTSYCYPITFSESGTAQFKVSGVTSFSSFSVLTYLSTVDTGSGGKPSSNISTNNGTSYTMSAYVEAGTTYYFWLRGYNSGVYIGKANVEISYITPSAGSVLSITSTATTITVQCSEITYATKYEFYIKKGNTTTDGLYSDQPSYEFTGLTPSTSYTINYRAWNGKQFGNTISGGKTIQTLEKVAISGGAYIYVNGWKKAQVYVYNGGWKEAAPYIYYGGWHQTTG